MSLGFTDATASGQETAYTDPSRHALIERIAADFDSVTGSRIAPQVRSLTAEFAQFFQEHKTLILSLAIGAFLLTIVSRSHQGSRR